MSLSSLLLSGGFALLATTAGQLAGLGGPAAAAVGAVTPLHLPGLVTGLMPLVGAAALGVLGRTSSNILNYSYVIFVVIRRLLHDMCWPHLLHHSRGSMLPLSDRR